MFEHNCASRFSYRNSQRIVSMLRIENVKKYGIAITTTAIQYRMVSHIDCWTEEINNEAETIFSNKCYPQLIGYSKPIIVAKTRFTICYLQK